MLRPLLKKVAPFFGAQKVFNFLEENIVEDCDAIDLLMQEIDEMESNEIGNPSLRYVIPDKRVIVASDAHVPYISYPLFRQLLKDIKRFEITCVIWAGDFMDLHQFSRFGVTDHHISYQDCKDRARRIVEITAKVLGPLGVQVISMGNHDRRWIKKLDNYDNLNGLYQSCGLTSMIEDGSLIISENPTLEAVEMTVNGELQSQWVIQHPFKYRAAFQNTSKLCEEEHKNALCAHSHHLGLKPYATKYWMAEAGGLYNPEKFSFVFDSPQNMEPMQPGYFVLIEDDAPIMRSGIKLGPKAVASRVKNVVRIPGR